MFKVMSRIACFSAALALLTTLALVGTESRALSDDCRACEKYLAFLPQYSLAGSVTAIGTAALHREGAEFDVDAQLADALKRQIAEDTRIPEGCRDWVKSKIHTGPRFSMVASGSVGARGFGAKPEQFAMSSDYPARMMGMFNGLVASYNPCASQRGQSGYTACLQQNAAGSYQKFSNQMANGTTVQIQNQLSGLGYGASAADVGLLKAFTAAINSGSTAGLMAWAKGASKALGTDAFLSAVQMMGYQMNNMYDYNRINGGPDTKGIVTVDQALASMNNGAMFMIQGWKDPSMLGDYKVVCRDAAVLQAQVLRAGGFPNSYTVSYWDQTGGHVDVITQDPNDRTKLYTINWFGRATHQGLDGAQVLFQGSGMGIPDHSMSYTVSSPDGKWVADVPSEMGKFLNEAAGGNNAVWDPLSRATSSIMAVSVSPDNKGLVQIRGIYGTDGNGASYMGVAGGVHWGAGTHFPGEAGVFVGQQFRPMDVYATSRNGTDLIGYGQAVQHAITPELKLGDNAKAVLDTHVAVSGALISATSGPDHSETGPNLNKEYDHRIGTEIRVDQKALGGKLKAQYVLGGNAMLGQADVRDANAATLVPLNLYAGARATLDVGGLTLFGQSMVVVDQIGARDKVEVGVAGRKVAASVYEAGRITNDTALVQDNTLRRVGVSLQAQPNKWLRLGATGEIPVEGPVLSGARVYGTAAVLF
jgi:hypothetical protein